MFEWSIFDPIVNNTDLGCDQLQHINKLCDDLSLSWTYNEGTPPAIAYKHFKIVFQHIFPLRVATIDGQHRQFMANKLFQGLSISRSVFPHETDDKELSKIPKDSTLFGNVNLVIQTPKEGKITPLLLRRSVKQSLATQQLRNQSNYKETYLQLLNQTYSAIDGLPCKATFKSMDDYWNYEFLVNKTKSKSAPGQEPPKQPKERCKWSIHVNAIILTCIDKYFNSSLATRPGEDGHRPGAFLQVIEAFRNRESGAKGRNFKPFSIVSELLQVPK